MHARDKLDLLVVEVERQLAAIGVLLAERGVVEAVDIVLHVVTHLRVGAQPLEFALVEPDAAAHERQRDALRRHHDRAALVERLHAHVGLVGRERHRTRGQLRRGERRQVDALGNVLGLPGQHARELRALGGRVGHLDLVLLAQPRLLAHLLHLGAHLARRRLVEHRRRRPDVEHHQPALARVRVALGLVADKVDGHDDVLRHKLVARDAHRAREHKVGERGVVELVDRLLYRLVVLAKARAERLVVGLACELDELRHVRDEPRVDLADVELLRNVRLQPADGVEGGLILVDEGDRRQRRAHRQLVPVADHAHLLDHLPHRRHVRLDLVVDRRLVHLGDHREVDRRGRVRHHLAQVLVDKLGEKGRERRHQAAEHDQHLVQRREGERALLGATLAREALLIHSDVPVGEQLDRAHESRHDRVQPVRLHLLPHVTAQRVGGGEDPAVHRVLRLKRELLAGRERHARRRLERVARLHQEAVRVVPRQEDVLEHLPDAILAEGQVLGAHDGRIDQVEPQRVGAVPVEDQIRLGVVLEALGHLAAVLRLHQAVADEVLEGRLVKESRREHHERVEPAARLVDALGDEIGREGRLELLLVLKGVVLLRVRHRAALEPAVEDLVDALELAAALGRLELDVVDRLAVQVGDLLTRKLLELFDGPNHLELLAVIRDPHRDGGAPEAVARDGPIARILEPIAEALLLDEVGHPVRLVVVGEQPVLERLDVDKR
mmetsp:Transcript_11764/g.30959  ORF Transcript_11764/g.30959 Transcript_11764/m.30959 type:complete len:724 (-) Transcript_11764:1012-3183(-)